jgi:hypothetical protein
MIRKLINKLYNFIQWTKKWHFCHVLFVPATFATLLTSDCFILLCLIYDLLQQHKTTSFEEIAAIHCFCYEITCICLFIPAVITQIFFITFNSIKSRKPFVTNNFLLNNKVYNTVYVIAIMYIILFIILFILF